MWADISLLVLRLAVGSVFAAHGAQKLMKGVAATAGGFENLGIPLPMVAAVVVIAVELGGGIALALGLLTRIAGGLLAIDMLVAMLLVHLPQGFFLPRGIEFVLVLFGASVALAGVGAGALSLDAALWGRHRTITGPVAATSVERPASRIRRAS
jgi:putative oxidoreductase